MDFTMEEFESLMNEVTDQDMAQSQIIAALEKDDFDTMASLLEEYEMEYGKDDFWYLVRVDLAEASDQPQQMIQNIEEAEQALGQSPLLELRKARYYFYITNYPEALKHANLAQFDEQSESYLAVQHIKGFTYVLLEQYDEAIKAFEDVLMDYYEPRIGLICGLLYNLEGKTDRAREYVEKAVRLQDEFDPDLQEALKVVNNDIDTILAHSKQLLSRLTQSFDENVQSDEGEDLLEQFDMLVSFLAEHPEKMQEYIKLEDQISDPDEKEFLQTILAKAHDLQGNEEGRKKYLRKIVQSPIYKGRDNDPSLSLSSHLMALKDAGYQSQTMVKYLNRWSMQLKNDSYCQLMIFQEATSMGLPKAAQQALQKINLNSEDPRVHRGLMIMDLASCVFDEDYQNALIIWHELQDLCDMDYASDLEFLLLALDYNTDEIFDTNLHPQQLPPALICAAEYCACLIGDKYGSAAFVVAEFAKNGPKDEVDFFINELCQDIDEDPDEFLSGLVYYIIKKLPLA